MPEIENPQYVVDRLTAVQKELKEGGSLASYEGVLIMHGDPAVDQDGINTAFSLHLVGFEFTKTAILILEDRTVVLSGGSKLLMLDPVVSLAESGDKYAPIERLKRAKKGSNADHLIQMLERVEAAAPAGRRAKLVAHVDAVDETGEFADDWRQQLEARAQTLEVAAGSAEQLERLLLQKDQAALLTMRRSARLTHKLFRAVLRDAVEEAADRKRHPTHAALAKQVTDALANPTEHGLKGFSEDRIQPVHGPVVQSGGHYDVDLLRLGLQSDDRKSSSDVVVMAWGAGYFNYSTFVARTLLINQNDAVQSIYKSLYEAHLTLVDELRPGTRICDAVRKARAQLRESVAAGKLPDHFGHGAGLLSREGQLALTIDNQTQLQPGMTLKVLTSVSELPVPEGCSLESLAMALGDTVVVGTNPERGPDVLTEKAKKEPGDVILEEGEEEEEEADDDGDDDGEDDGEEASAGAGGQRRSRRLSAQRQRGSTMDAARRTEMEQEQERLREKQRLAAVRKLERGEGVQREEDEGEDLSKIADLASYDSMAEYPSRHLRPNQMYVDKERQTVFVPVYGVHVPFHIATIKTVARDENAGVATLRFNFYTSASSTPKDCPKGMAKALAQFGANSLFVKTLTFQTRNHRNVNMSERIIKDVQKRLRQRAAQQRETEGLVRQARLVIDRKIRVPRLQGVNMRPSMSGKKAQGALEAHINGLRFRGDKGDVLDITYENIRHAVFQPCQRTLIVLLHLYLHNPIMVGKKKRRNIQFYTEVISASESLENHSRSIYDQDEQEGERKQNALRKQYNERYRIFANKVQAMAVREPHSHSLEFDMPTPELGFMGNPGKEMVKISPAANCLVSLTEWPPFVLSLDDVDHVHFERVLYVSKNFDMVFIFKEGVRKKSEDQFVRISTIPTESLDTIKQWLTSVLGVTYSVGEGAMNWKLVINEIVRDPYFFMDQDENGEPKPAGWDTFDASKAQAEEAELEDDDDEDAFSAPDDDEEEEEEDFDDEMGSEEDEDDYAEEEDDDEEEADWEELEAQARADDRRSERKDLERDEEAGRKRRDAPRGRAAAGGGAAKRRR